VNALRIINKPLSGVPPIFKGVFMTNDLENQSSDLSEDFLTHAFIEDAVDEEDALASVGQEDADLISTN
jgi:hypothetical protein